MRALAFRPVVVLTLACLLLGPFGLPAVAEPAATIDPFPQCGGPVDLEVLFLFDTTGSMGGVISDAQLGASDIMTNVLTAFPGARFGVANYRDYPGTYSYPGYSATYGGLGDYPWSLDQGLTTDTGLVQAAIDGLVAGGGADTPESLSRAIEETRQIGFSPGAVKVVVLFADAPPHDLDFAGTNTGGDPGPDAIAGNADDVDFETTVAASATAGIQYVVIDSGGGFAADHFRHLASETDGAYALLSEDFVQQVTDLILSLAPQPSARADAAVLIAETSVPANPLVRVGTVHADANGTTHTDRVHQVDVAALGASFYIGTSTARTAGNETTLHAHANASITSFTLLGGLIRGETVSAHADSFTSTDISATSAAGTRIAALTVGTTTLTDPIAPNTVIPFPGGVVIVNEQRVHDVSEQASEIEVNALHVVIDDAAIRGHIKIGHAYAATSCAPDLGALLASRDNDAGTGADAGDTTAEATVVATPALFQGHLDADDIDAYRFVATPGEKVSAYLLPSTRAAADQGRVGTGPAITAGLPDLTLTLHQPVDFAVREASDLAASAPERVELNVDVAGEWVVRLGASPSASPAHANYTLALVVSPILLDDQNDAASGDDAPDSCSGALAILPGPHRGVLRDDDRVDAYAVSAAIGDELAITLKPTEDADGADFDLYLYNNACSTLALSNLGKGIVPKGTPDLVVLLPVERSGTYRFEVVRHNGIGNYYLDVEVRDPQPTAAPIDAESAGDAGSTQGTAQPVASPGVHQARMPDGDTADWFAFAATTGERITVTHLPSTLSDLRLSLVRPDGSAVPGTASVAGAAAVVHTTADQSGTWYLRIIKNSGGGDYTFGVATT